MSFLQAVKGNVNKAFLGQKHSVSVWIPAIKSAIIVTPLIFISLLNRVVLQSTWPRTSPSRTWRRVSI